jgi:phenylalanine-4-hydroxylase
LFLGKQVAAIDAWAHHTMDYTTKEDTLWKNLADNQKQIVQGRPAGAT